MPYAGQLAEIPAGAGTLTSDNHAASTRFYDLIVAEGIVSERGVWEREPGAAPYTNTSLGSAKASFAFSARSVGVGAVFASYKLTGAFQYLGLNTTWAAVLGTKTVQVGEFGTQTSVPSGSAVVITATRYNTNLTCITAITDDAGNTYQMVGRSTLSATGAVELWVALNCAPLAKGQNIYIQLSAGAGSNPNICVGGVHVVSGLRALDETFNLSAGAGATSLTQPTRFTLAEQSEAVLIAYGDGDNASGVHASPSELTGTVTASCAVGSEFFYGTLPFQQAKPNALADYWPTAAVQRLLAVGSDGIVYKSSGAEFTSLAMATVLADAAAMIVIGGQETAGAPRKAFFFDSGNNRIQTLTGDGSSTTDFGNGWNTSTNIPVDWATNAPRGGVIHKERLWCWAPANAPHNVYASKLRDHENFKNAVGGTFEYVQEIGTGTGLRLAAFASFKGMLFAFKYPRGIWFLDDTDVDYLNWRWNLVTDSVGVADSPYSVIVLDEDILFIAPDGHLHFLSAVTQQGITSADLTAKSNLQQWTRDNLNLNRLSRMTSTWYGAKKLAMIGLSSPEATANNLRVFLDFSNASDTGIVRMSYSHRDVNRVLTVRRDSSTSGYQRPIFGDDDGLIWLMDQESKQKVGVPNVGQARYQYSPTDFSHVDPSLANKRKLFDALTVTFNPTGAWNIAIDTIIDGNYHETIYFSMGGGASVLGEFQFGGHLGGDTITTNRRRMTGHGYWLSLAGWVQGEGHDFSVANHLVNFRVGGEEQR